MASQYFSDYFKHKVAPASLPSTVAPTFAGITQLVQNLDGSLLANWAAATVAPNPPIMYEVYLQESTATGLFNVANIIAITRNLNFRIFTDNLGNILQVGKTYHVGVRAIDAYSNRESNSVSFSQTITNANFNTLAGAVWDVVRSTKTTVGTFGESLTAKVDVNVSTRSSQTSVDEVNTKATNIKKNTDLIPGAL